MITLGDLVVGRPGLCLVVLLSFRNISSQYPPSLVDVSLQI